MKERLGEGYARLVKEVAWNFLQSSANYVLPLFSFSYISSNIAKSEYGQYVTLTAVGTLFLVLLDFGLGVYCGALISRAKSASSRNLIVSNAVLVKFSIFASCVLFLSITCFFIPEAKIILIYIATLFFLSIYPDFYFRAVQKARINAAIQWLQGATYVALIVAFIDSNSTVQDIIYCTACSYVISSAFGWYVMIRRESFQVEVSSLKAILNLVGELKGIFLSRVLTIGISPLSVFLVYFGGAGRETIADYGVANNIISMIKGVYTPVADACLPFFNKSGNASQASKIALFLTFGNCIAISAVYFFSEEVVTLISSKSYVESTMYIKPLLLSCLIVLPSYLLGYPALSGIGKLKYANLSAYLGSSVFGVFILYGYIQNSLAPNYIILAVILAELATLIMRVFVVARSVQSGGRKIDA